MSNGFDKLTGAIGQTIKTIPDVYDDMLKPSAQEVGKTLALIPRTINAALAPLQQWIAQKEYNVEETEKLLSQKLQNVLPEKITSPEAYIAVPAIQAISYSMSSEELRELYANLLAKSMCIDTKDRVHPSFVEVIKQMSPADASIYRYLYGLGARPFINIFVSLGIEGIIDEIYHYTNFGIYDQDTRQVCISNLLRLGLIDIPENIKCADKSVYEPLQNEAKAEISSRIQFDYPIEPYFEFEQRIINISAFGHEFYNICVV